MASSSSATVMPSIQIQGWENLPQPILADIFERLDRGDLVRGAPLCCKSWFDASSSFFTTANLYLCHGPPNPTRVLQFYIFRSKGELTSIEFPNTANFNDLLRVTLRCRKIKSLMAMTWARYIDENNTLKFRRAITMLSELKYLEVPACFMEDRPTVEDISRSCPNLNKLKLHFLMGHNAASHIRNSFPRLKALYIDTIEWGNDLVNIVQCCKELEVLHVFEWNRPSLHLKITDVVDAQPQLKDFKWGVPTK